MKIMHTLSEYNEGCTCDNNPEIILLRRQDDEYEADVTESFWSSGTAVTSVKHSNDN